MASLPGPIIAEMRHTSSASSGRSTARALGGYGATSLMPRSSNRWEASWARGQSSHLRPPATI